MKNNETKLKNYFGMTIIEMLVAISIFTVGILGFTLLFSRSWRSNSYALEMGNSSVAASSGVSTIGNYIRGVRQADDGSYPVGSATDNDLVLYADYDKDDVTERLHFYKNGQDILMGVTDPTGTMPKTYAAEDQQVTTLVTNIVNDAGTPIFYYYDASYSGAEGQSELSTPANVSAVRLIKIYLKVNIDPNRAPDNIEMQSFIELRNLNDYNLNQ